MILVTLGTQRHNFSRLLKNIEKLSLNEEIVIQYGYTNYKNEKFKCFDFLSYEEMDKLINQARIIITHAGTGAIVTPLKKGKIVIACARRKKYHEHINDHQLEILESFAKANYIIPYKENDNLKSIIENIDTYKIVEFKSNQNYFINQLKKIIEEL